MHFTHRKFVHVVITKNFLARHFVWLVILVSTTMTSNRYSASSVLSDSLRIAPSSPAALSVVLVHQHLNLEVLRVWNVTQESMVMIVSFALVENFVPLQRVLMLAFRVWKVDINRRISVLPILHAEDSAPNSALLLFFWFTQISPGIYSIREKIWEYLSIL